MAPLDWVIAAVMALSLVLGAVRGLVHEVISVVGWVVAFVMAQWLAPAVAVRLPFLQGSSNSVQYAAGFVLVFVAVIFLVGLMSWMLGHLMGAVGLKPADRALGAIFGLIRGLVILMVLAVLVRLAGFSTQSWWSDAVLVPWLQALLEGLRPVMPQAWQDFMA